MCERGDWLKRFKRVIEVRVIDVSLETQKIVAALPALDIRDDG